MPDNIKRIDYYYVSVPDKPGEGARILAGLCDAGVNLIGVSAFPHGARRSQLDLVPEDSATFAKAARAAGLTLRQTEERFSHPGRRPAGSRRRHRKETALPSRIYGRILVQGVVPSCDKGQFPWPRRCGSHRIVW
jgi:hypothetical protein